MASSNTLQEASGSGRLTQAQRRDESSLRLFDAAFRLLAKGGVRALSLAAIAKAAGCSRELPRYHFGSKDAFVEALIDDCERVFGEHLQRPQSEGRVGMDAVLALFDSLDEFFTEPQVTRGRLTLLNELANSDNDRLRKKIASVHAATRRHIVNILEDGIAAGKLAPIEDTNAYAMLLHGTYRGIGFQWVINPRSMDIKVVLRQLRAIFMPSLLSR